MKKTLAALRRREQRRTRDPLPERLLKYLRRQPQTLCLGELQIVAARATEVAA